LVATVIGQPFFVQDFYQIINTFFRGHLDKIEHLRIEGFDDRGNAFELRLTGHIPAKLFQLAGANARRGENLCIEGNNTQRHLGDGLTRNTEDYRNNQIESLHMQSHAVSRKMRKKASYSMNVPSTIRA